MIPSIPQVAEAKIPLPMDAAEEKFVYYGCSEIHKHHNNPDKGPPP